ncbi:hypothetical protein EDD16DRAFT_1720994 [Pisolithus croceorrhizus]|nr:hypothetical protein EDD16DRAFT_1720994 [Pisolithus croceorrhizus]
MAMRYLYRVVLIRTGRDILALDHTLRNYAAGNGSFVGMRSPGHWTRRLDITLDFSNESECEDPDRCVKRLAGVIQFLPKLEIVSFAITGDLGSEPNIIPLSVIDALRSSAKSLCILDWSRYNFFPQLHQLEELLRDLPNLRVLRCRELESFPAVFFPRSLLLPWTDWLREWAILLIRRRAVEELVQWSSKVSTEAIMKNLDESPFRVEDDEGNLLSGGSAPWQKRARPFTPLDISSGNDRHRTSSAGDKPTLYRNV